MNVLVLSILSNSRYETAGEAIKEYMEQNVKYCSVHIVNIFKYINSFVDKLESDGLLKAPKRPHPMYDIYSTEDYFSGPCTMLHDALCMKLDEIIDEIKPCVIISDHPFLLQLLLNITKKGRVNIPVIALITRFDPCCEWVHDFVKAYVVPSEDAKNRLMEKGAEGGKIYPFGIPVNALFSVNVDRDKLLHILKLRSKKTLLVFGTSMGARESVELFKSLAYSKLDIQLIFYEPCNINLQKHLQTIAADCSKNVRICGLTESVSDLMAASDIMIAKPESMIISTALARGIPIVMIPPFQGPMQYNAEYLLSNGAAFLVGKNENPADVVGCLINDDMTMELIKQNIKKISNPCAVMDTARLILDISGGNPKSIPLNI